MLRLSRTRRNDPVLTCGHDEPGQRVCGRLEPSMEPLQPDDVEARVDLETLLRHYPEYRQRVAIIARNPLASVDGFRVIVMLTYRFLFGMKVCPFCPDCNNGEHSIPCQDIFGNSSAPEGGVFGRIEAGFTSIEAQKSKGSLHAHSQLFVQCLHQHTPLAALIVQLASNSDIVQDYLTYKSHVSRQVYADPQRADARLQLLEADWPEYPQSTALMPVRQYLATQAAEDPANSDHTPDLNEARCWLREYLDDHVQDLQEHRQHHIHIMTEDGTRVPLAHCKRLDNPDLCKSDFPRTKWLIERPVILCKCLLHEMDMPASGKKTSWEVYTDP